MITSFTSCIFLNSLIYQLQDLTSLVLANSVHALVVLPNVTRLIPHLVINSANAPMVHSTTKNVQVNVFM